MAITKVSTLEMSHEEWLEQRRHSIGGSDAASLLGLNDYASPYSLWAEKTGKVVPEDISDKEAVRLGNDLEQYVADRFMEATGKKVRRDNHIIYNDEYPFAHANIDRAVVGENAGLECKTTSSFDIVKQCRAGNFPVRWYVQMTHYMMVTGADRWYLGVCCFGSGFFHFCIERNQAEIDSLARAEKEFWRKVEAKEEPGFDGSEADMGALKTILADSNPDSIDLGTVATNIEMLEALKAQQKDIEKKINAQQAEIMSFMGEAERGRYGKYKVSFKTQIRNTFDRKKFEKANGAIPEEFFKASTSRPFRMTVEAE